MNLNFSPRSLTPVFRYPARFQKCAILLNKFPYLKIVLPTLPCVCVSMSPSSAPLYSDFSLPSLSPSRRLPPCHSPSLSFLLTSLTSYLPYLSHLRSSIYQFSFSPSFSLSFLHFIFPLLLSPSISLFLLLSFH